MLGILHVIGAAQSSATSSGLVRAGRLLHLSQQAEVKRSPKLPQTCSN